MTKQQQSFITLVVIEILTIAFWFIFSGNSARFAHRATDVPAPTDSKDVVRYASEAPLSFSFEYPRSWALSGREAPQADYQVLARVANSSASQEGDTAAFEQFLVRRLAGECPTTDTTDPSKAEFDSGWSPDLGGVSYRSHCIPLSGGGGLQLDGSALSSSGKAAVDSILLSFTSSM